MAKFKVGEIAIFVVPGGRTSPAPSWLEVEVISSEHKESTWPYEVGYDCMVPGHPCERELSKNGEWFIPTQALRKKKPPEESDDIKATREQGAPSFPKMMEGLKQREEVE